MSDFKKKYGPFIACAAMSCTFMVPINISPAIADMIMAYGNPHLITLMMTIGPLFSIPATLITGKLSETVSKKVLGIIGMVIILVAGVIPTWMGSDLVMMNVMRAIQGFGLGMVFSVAPTIPADNFEPGAARNACLGIHGAFAGAGMFVYNYLAGWLVTTGINNVFLTYLMTIPLIVLVWIFMPQKPLFADYSIQSLDSTGVKENTFDKKSLHFVADIFIFLIIIMACTIDTSNYVVGCGLGDSIDAGLVSTIFSISAFLGGFLFPVITGKLKNYTRPFGTFLAIIGLFFFVYTGELGVTQIAAAIAGFGVSMHNPANINTAQNWVRPVAITMTIALIGTANTLGQTVSTYVTGAFANLIDGTVISRFYVSAIIATLLLIYELIFAFKHKDI